jgi:hypothetical protein
MAGEHEGNILASALRRALFRDEAPEGCDLAYRNLTHSTKRGSLTARRRCEELWCLFEPLADPVFLERLPFEFHQRWFEMYVGAALIDAGLDVRAPTPGRGPDFEIHAGGRRIYVEAVCPTGGDPEHPDAVPEPVYRDAEGRLVAVQVPHDRITLRIASAVRAKLNVFDRYRVRGLVGPEDACIVAVNLRGIPQAWADSKEFFFRAVYGMGNQYAEIDRQSGKIVSAGREHRAILLRSSGAAEAVAPLLNPAHSDVCAILGSSVDAGNVRSPLGDDFVLMSHASAKVPFPLGLIGRGAEFALRPGDQSGCWDVDETDYGVPESHGTEKFLLEFEGRETEGEWEISGRELKVRVGGRGCSVEFRKDSEDPAAAARAIARELLWAAARRGPA